MNGREGGMLSPTAKGTASATDDPLLSGLQRFILQNTPSPRDSYALGSATDTLALRIAHNLRFQHNWSAIRIHYLTSAAGQTLPRPVLSGLPPQRLYVPPDEQIEVLKKQRDQGKAGWPDFGSEREWVLPSHLRETWTLRRFAEIFDVLEKIPPPNHGGALNFAAGSQAQKVAESQEQKSPSVSSVATPMNSYGRVQAAAESDIGPPGLPTDSSATPQQSSPDVTPAPNSACTTTTTTASTTPQEPNPWRTKQPKRVLLATLDDDSTIVYYVVHDGIVKPRQN